MIYTFGSINTDIVVQVPHHVQAGETLIGSNAAEGPGGKGANQALAAKRAGGDVTMIGAVGSDPFALTALSMLKADGVDTKHIAKTKSATGLAFIFIDKNGENSIVVTPGANADVTAAQMDDVTFEIGDFVVTQNEVDFKQTALVHERAKKAGAKIIHNAAPSHSITLEQLANIDFLIVNEIEVMDVGKALGCKATNPEAMATELAEMAPCQIVTTLGPDGALLNSKSQMLRVAAPQTKVVDTTGAGDTFIGYFAASLARHETLNHALEQAVKAASLACTKAGAQRAMPHLSDLKN